LALIARFHTNVIKQMGLWAEQAEAEIRSWPGTAGLGMTRHTRATLEDLLAPARTARRPRRGGR
jgi:hypothetical protein